MHCFNLSSSILTPPPFQTHTLTLALCLFLCLCLSLTLCLSLIYNEWTDLLCMLCLHVMSEVRYRGFGPQHVPKLHAVSLTDTLSTRAVHTRTRGWRVRVRRDVCCVPLPEDTVNNSCSQTRAHTRPLFSLNSNSCLKCASSAWRILASSHFPFQPELPKTQQTSSNEMWVSQTPMNWNSYFLIKCSQQSCRRRVYIEYVLCRALKISPLPSNIIQPPLSLCGGVPCLGLSYTPIVHTQRTKVAG